MRIRLVFDEFLFNVTSGCQLAEARLTICLFQAFKERVLLPVEAAVWPSGRCLFSLRFPFFRFGSAKVRRSFQLPTNNQSFFSIESGLKTKAGLVRGGQECKPIADLF